MPGDDDPGHHLAPDRPDQETDRPDQETDRPDQETVRFEEFYRATYPALLGYLLRRVADHAVAADALADTYTVVWRRRADLPAGDDARAWLFGVARNVLANGRRSQRRQDELTERLRVDVARLHAVLPAAPSGAEAVAIRDALGRLDQRDREVLTLVAWEGLSREQLAVALNCSRGTARVRLHRARRRFAEALRREGVDTTAYVTYAQTQEVHP